MRSSICFGFASSIVPQADSGAQNAKAAVAHTRQLDRVKKRRAGECEGFGSARSLLRPDAPPFSGHFYAWEPMRLESFPVRPSGPQMWVGSWGSDAGLRRVACLGDGWLGSAFHITPESFADGLARLRVFLKQVGKEPDAFPHALGTMFLYLTDDRRRAGEVLDGLLSPTMGRPADVVRERVLVGSAHECIEKLAKLQAVGVRKIFLWPVADNAEQLEKFHQEVLPQLPQ